MFDFLRYTRETDRYNFHGHTQFCDGRATMAEFAEAVSAQGFKYWGFTPHSPVPVDSPCNMLWDDVDAYLAEVKRLGEKYDDVKFFAAMEVDYLGPQFGPASDRIQALPLDYRIGSVHFIPDQDGNYVDIDGSFESFRIKMHAHFREDIRYVVETFYAQSVAMVRARGFDLIGHLDKIGQNANYYQSGVEQQPWYREALHALLDEVVRSGLTVEINTKALANHHRIFPSRACVEYLQRAGVPVIVNSDAHVPALANAGREYGLRLLQNPLTQRNPSA